LTNTKFAKNSFTYKDYLSWDDNVRVELLDGIVYMMSSPSIWHQDTAGNLYAQLHNFLKGKPCRVFIAPCDVRPFPKDDLSDNTVVQPDILVVCDESKIGENGINGVPDFIIEIESPGSRGKDLIDKKELYEKAGVKEYWVVGKNGVSKFVLIDGVYHENVTEKTMSAKIPVTILKGCTLEL